MFGKFRSGFTLLSKILWVIIVGNRKSKCSKGGEVANIPLGEGGYRVLTTLPCFLKASTGRSPKQHSDSRLQHLPITRVTDSSLLQDGEFAVVTTIAQYNIVKLMLQSTYVGELCLRIDFLF